MLEKIRRRGARRRPGHPPTYLFVVTYGRSGSTLIQGLLNALPGVLVRGENNLFVLPLYRACAEATAFRDKHLAHRPNQPTSAFYGVRSLRRQRFVLATRRLATEVLLGGTPRADVRVLGFKEVLWHRVEPHEREDFFDFMDEAFPGARYVLNQRRHEDVLTSGFWRRRDADEAAEALRSVEEIQAFLRRTRPDRVLDLRYELLTSDDEAVSGAQLRSLATFTVGACSDDDLAALRRTMATGHGPQAFGASKGGGAS